MPNPASESCFVADDDFGRLGVSHEVTTSDPVVSVAIKTTRCIGSVNADDFLRHPDWHSEQGTLARTLLLTIRAQIGALDAGGSPGEGGVDVGERNRLATVTTPGW
ncbi:hypothetical protein [Nonomuraea sp. GTA35]|uniref:hypothetical protein n=1 Tax=Nonomuraea sp. GTA35 TaxID=1676746 RepID=UPI0035BF1270